MSVSNVYDINGQLIYIEHDGGWFTPNGKCAFLVEDGKVRTEPNLSPSFFLMDGWYCTIDGKHMFEVR